MTRETMPCVIQTVRLNFVDRKDRFFLCSVLRVRSSNFIVGVDGGEGTPVPIPNTEVKLTCADNTWLATAREDKKMPTQNKTPSDSSEGVFAFVLFRKLCRNGWLHCRGDFRVARGR